MNSRKDIELTATRKKPHVAFHLYFGLLIMALCFSLPGWSQKKQLVQVKTFDQQLVPYKNIEVSINNKEYVSMGNKGVAFVELLDTDFPLQSVRIKDEKLETASWNYGKGIIEIIVRTKSYQMVKVLVLNENNAAIRDVSVTYKGKKTTTERTNAEGNVEIPLALDEKVTAPEQFSIPDYKVVKVQMIDGVARLNVEPIKVASVVPTIQQPVSKATYFKDFDLSKLDSIQSLTAFYAIFKSLPIKDMSEAEKLRIDRKFEQLVAQLQDSVQRSNPKVVGRISDSSFVADDIRNMLSQATEESAMLEAQRVDFENKIEIIQNKLAAGISSMDESTRANLLSDLTRLEMLLGQNEKQFYKNQNDYRAIINSLKEKYFDITELENKLSQSEAQRLEEQRAFRQKLLITSSILIVFGAMIVLLIYFGAKLRKQKKELIRVNDEINMINAHLEDLVTERTKLLEEANKELDTFLYRAAHDLRTPVCSIIGLCNIALHMSHGESKDLVERVVVTTGAMDKLLKKLSIISEINQPTDFTSLTLLDLIEKVRQGFKKNLHDQKIDLSIKCAGDMVIYSYPNLVETILNNLIENAMFYSALKDSNHPRVEISAEIKNDHVEISVHDNGIGIDAAMHPRLFDMFFKGNENSKGNGLGLYIVQKSVHALDGTVKVESEVGKFTKFMVQFPLKPMEVNDRQRKIELPLNLLN